MDSGVSENTTSRSLRRSARHLSGNVSISEPTPRGPLKRTKRGLEDRAPAAAVNGSRDAEKDSEDEDSPRKKSRLEPGGEGGGSGDDIEMDAEESAEDEENDEDQEMDTRQAQLKTFKGGIGDTNLFPRVVLGDRCPPSCTLNKDANSKIPIRAKTSTKVPEASIKSAPRSRAPASRHDKPNMKITMEEYRRKMEDQIKSSGIPTFNHRVSSMYTRPEKPYTTRQRVNNTVTQKETIQHKKEGKKKTAVIERSSGYSCRGFMWCLLRLVLLMLLGSGVLLAYKTMPVLQKIAKGGVHPSRAVKPEHFADQLSLLETHFPSQQPELWKRSKIHLEKHLRTAQPTEPVSLIFTAGQKAEKTLRCLAHGLASAFSSALNASVLHIDGAGKAGQDSDEVKLDIDGQLKAAFEGDKPVAVIHRFEELPPGSTLIFYRYCDHENAAYKRVFLLFTVLLPLDEVSGDQSLKEVEEMVLDYVKKRLVDSSKQTAFNEMDTDKYGGLWSRISHLILPVVSEKEVELKGC